MPTQRSGSPESNGSGSPESNGSGSRREFLAGIAATVAACGTAGCPGAVGGRRAAEPVSILAAGSLQRALSGAFREPLETPIRIEAHGSVTVARLVAAGKRDPDLVAVADPALFANPLDVEWYAEFATNALVVALADTEGGRRVGRASRWFEPIVRGRATLGRTDPAVDPLGYRTRFAVELAAAYYDRPDLPDELLAPDQVYPETALLSRLETAAVDAAVVYRSMAVDRAVPFIDLPTAIDLSDPERDDHYATVSYTLPDGTVVRGEHVSYAAHARRTDEPVRTVYDRLIAGDYLDEHGFTTPRSLPRYRGSPPPALEG